MTEINLHCRKMRQSNFSTREIEKTLESLRPRHVPPGLKARILAPALEARNNRALTTLMAKAALVCAALILVTILGDSITSNYQASALLAIVKGPAVALQAKEESKPPLAEVSQEESALGTQIFGKNLYGRVLLIRTDSGRRSVKESLEALKMLKGWIDNEVSENPY